MSSTRENDADSIASEGSVPKVAVPKSKSTRHRWTDEEDILILKQYILKCEETKEKHKIHAAIYKAVVTVIPSVSTRAVKDRLEAMIRNFRA